MRGRAPIRVLPYAPPTAAALQAGLQRALARLRARGVDLKVAIVAVPSDLGAVANRAPGLRRLPRSRDLAHHGPDGLARSALDAVVRLSRAMGHPIAAPAIAASSTGPARSLPG